jgi:hypothetical protein
MVNGLGLTELRIEKEVVLLFKLPKSAPRSVNKFYREREGIPSWHVNRFKEVAMF